MRWSNHTLEWWWQLTSHMTALYPSFPSPTWSVLPLPLAYLPCFSFTTPHFPSGTLPFSILPSLSLSHVYIHVYIIRIYLFLVYSLLSFSLPLLSCAVCSLLSRLFPFVPFFSLSPFTSFHDQYSGRCHKVYFLSLPHDLFLLSSPLLSCPSCCSHLPPPPVSHFMTNILEDVIRSTSFPSLMIYSCSPRLSSLAHPAVVTYPPLLSLISWPIFWKMS